MTTKFCEKCKRFTQHDRKSYYHDWFCKLCGTKKSIDSNGERESQQQFDTWEEKRGER